MADETGREAKGSASREPPGTEKGLTRMSDYPSPRPALSYRADIDGLRAVAVLIVVAFHVGILRLTGGYIGVDVFFVISGYLISSIMFANIAANRFSVIAFYERRIRRIFPALFVMLITMSVFALVFFLPSELVDFAKTCVSAATSFSNFYLWKQTGYFDRRNANFLLHTWSLAVEEQFYILFPLFLVAVRRFFPSRLKAAVVILFAASLTASVVLVYKSPETAFYMPYTRAWELLLGTILSLGLFPGPRTAWMRNAYALGGLAMIGYSAIRYTSVTVFPGLNAIAPCLGSALIISAGEEGPSVVSAVLSWRPVVFVGLISYSLYLWHWPVIMVYRMGTLTNLSAWFERHYGAAFHPDRFDHIVQIAVSFALAILSWRFVERPFRKGRMRLSGRPLFALAGAVMLVCIGISAAAIFSGRKARFSSQTLQIASYLDPAVLRQEEKAQRMGTCFLDATTGVENFDLSACLRLDGGRKNYLLLGDSHAAALWPALEAALPAVNVMQVNVTACMPLVDRSSGDLCGKVMDYMYADWLLRTGWTS